MKRRRKLKVMKPKTFLLTMVLFLYAVPFCISQNKVLGDPHPGYKKVKTIDISTKTVQQKLADLFESLAKASTVAEKADYYFWIARYYASALKIDSSLYYSNKIKEVSEPASYEHGMGIYYFARNYALFFRNKTNEDELKKAIGIFAKYKDNLFSGLAHRQLGKFYDGMEDFTLSRKNYHTAINFFILSNNEREHQWTLYELGKSFYKTYEIDSSAACHVASLRMAEKFNDLNRICSVSGYLGELYIITGDLRKAADYLKYSFDSRSPTSSKVEIRSRLGSYAVCLSELGELSKAAEAIKEYESINNLYKDAWGAIHLKKIKGVYAHAQGNNKEALAYLREAYNRSGEISNFGFDVKNIALCLGIVEYKTGHYDSAIHHLTIVRRLAEQLKFVLDMVEPSLLISQSFEKKGNTDSAYYYFRHYARLKDSIVTVQKEKSVMELTAKYETEKKEQQIKLLEKEKDLYGIQLRLKNEQLEKQNLLNSQRTQELALLSQQNQINRLEASKNSLALENQQKEIDKKQNELVLLSKENQLQAAITGKESQRKNFAYLAIAGILLFSSYVYYRSVRNKKLSRQLAASLVELKQAQTQLIKAEKEKEAENIRVRISRDIHDEVGATLSGVALFSEIAKQKMALHHDHDVQQYLEHISTNSKEMVEKMSDIVWAINPQNDSFDRIIAKLESYAVNVCAGKGIKLHLDIDESIRSYYPGMQVRKNIYMLIKEAINNAVKYSNSRNIYFSLRNPDGNMMVEIRDDGEGFDTRMIRKGNGLNNMEARAAELKAAFRLQSGEGNGTSVSFQFNFHPSGGHPEVV
jgi:two-component system, NarL family, sensor histidine kinase UhpB